MRDEFAGKAINGLLSSTGYLQSLLRAPGQLRDGSTIHEVAAQGAYKFADAMMAERERRYGSDGAPH